MAGHSLSDRRHRGEPGAPPRDRTGHRPFCRASVCPCHRRHRLCDLLPADPRAGPGRPRFRGAQPWRIARLPRPPGLGQPLGFRAHRRGLAHQASPAALARRLARGARDPAGHVRTRRVSQEPREVSAINCRRRDCGRRNSSQGTPGCRSSARCASEEHFRRNNKRRWKQRNRQRPAG